MPRPCSVCVHPRRAEIEQHALAPGASFSAVARRHGLTRDPLRRHVEKHIAPRVAEAVQEEQATTARDLLKYLDGLRERAESILASVEDSDPALAIRAIAELRQLVRSSFEALEVGELVDRLDELERKLNTPPRPRLSA